MNSKIVRIQQKMAVLGYAAHLLRRSPLSLLGMVIVLGLVLIGTLAPLIAPYPDVPYPSIRLNPPSQNHIFGTDEMGRDIFGRIVYGSQVSLTVGIIVVLIAMSVGIPLGLTSGFLGGKVDGFIMRVTDIFLSIPPLLLAMLILATSGPSIPNMMAAIAITMWPAHARLVRGNTLAIKEQSYIEAARAFSASTTRIIFRHILPNCLSPIIVQTTFDVGNAILWASALGFLGLGARPPTPEWGLMIATGRIYMPIWWWCATFPGIAIFLTVLGFNLFGDGLRDILDPRTRR